jgi:hypothetical protein
MFGLQGKTALDKDRRTAKFRGAEVLQHRHYAFIASVIASMPTSTAEYRARKDFTMWTFVSAMEANPRFDRNRFVAACMAGEE